MSKSRKNVVDPDDIIAHFGADTARLFIVSDSPPDRDIIWTEAGVAGRRAAGAAHLAADRRGGRRKNPIKKGAQSQPASGPRPMPCAAPPTRH